MTTAYLFNLPYHGHVNPCVPLVQTLTRRGVRVICYGTAEFRRMLQSAGGLFRCIDYEEENKGGGLTSLGEWQMRVTESCMSRLVSDASADNPEYVLTDYSCLWGRCLAAHLGSLVVIVHTTFPTPFSYRRAARVTLKELRRSAEMRRIFYRFLRADHRLARKWGVPRVGIPFNVLCPRGDLHLVLTTRQLSPDIPGLDSRYVFVGPCVRLPGSTHADCLPPLDEKPLVYVSLGTVWNDRPHFFRACIDAYRDAGFQVVIALGRDFSHEVLGPVPPHIHLCRYIDQIEILQRAAVFVTHGGMNSICEALLAGVPMLVFPQAVDQFSLARYVDTHGAGKELGSSDLTPTALREATERILSDPVVRARCREIGNRLLEDGGPERAAELIMKLPVAASGTSVTARWT